MIQEWNVQERNRAPFVMALNSALVVEKNAQKTLDDYREKEAEARELGNYDAQLQVYEESLQDASKRVQSLTQEFAQFDQLIAQREQAARTQEDEQALQMFRTVLRGAQVAMEQGTAEEKDIVKRLMGLKK